jgi:hypothetical protein
MQEQLPDFVLASLYPSSLVIVETTQLATEKTAIEIERELPNTTLSTPALERPSNWYLGNNQQNIVILVQEPNAAFLQESSLDFLTKILGACKLNMGDVAVVNLSRYLAPYAEIKEALNPKVCILFDVQAAMVKLPFVIPNYQVQQYAGCQFLLAPALTKYEGDQPEAKLEKTKLWVSLKLIFKL